MTILRTNTIAGTGTTFGPLLDGNLEFNSQNYIILPKGSSSQEGVLRNTADVVGTGGTFYDNLVLAMPFNAATGLTDVSSRNRNPAAYGNVAISTAQSKYYGSSAIFDGSGDYLTVGTSNDYVFGTGDYTLECWAYFSTLNSENSLASTHNADANWTWKVVSNKLRIYTGTTDVDGTSTITTGSWFHFAVSRQSSTLRLFVNGINETTTTSSNNYTINNILHIGAQQNNLAGTYINGYIQDLRIYKGLAKYTANFTPPERIAEVGVGFKTGQLRYNTDSNKVELYDGSQWTEVQSSRPDLNGGARGVFAGGYSPSSPSQSNVIGYITISTTGNAIDFGDLTIARIALGGLASSTRGIFAGGIATPLNHNTIDFITISSTGNASDFGDLTLARHWVQTGSNSTRGLFAGGNAGPFSNVIDYVTISSTGDARDFGDLMVGKTITSGSSCSSSTRSIFGGGYSAPSLTNTIEFVTTSTLGNSQDFGDFTIARGREGRCSNAIRGLFGGNSGPSNTIDFITIATLGNAVDFGDLTVARENLSGCSSSTRGVFGGGQTPTNLNTIDYVTIMTQGNAVDFGDMTIVSNHLAACSNAHGGL